jgi:4-amino-4-deoxy-L-arabinose transferase-like glycosyltransferase
MKDEHAPIGADLKALGILALLTAVCFLPLLGKAFHIDEPLFIWTARHILVNPLDFYGFNVNWEGVAEPIATVAQNPPLAAYYLALWARLFGWGEFPLHLGFLLLGFAAAAGSYRLARDMSLSPALALFAALAVFSTPAFFISADSVMCDIAMVAVWVWAVVWWRRALEGDDRLLFLLGGAAVLVCALCKYFGCALIPLLLVYSLFWRRRAGFWLVALLLPVLALGCYQVLTSQMYGRGLLSSAAAYASGLSVGGGMTLKTLTGLTFLGGSLVSVVCCLPLASGKKGALCCLAGFLVLFACLSFFRLPGFNASAPLYVVQAALLGAAGAGVLVLMVSEAWHRRDPDTLLLLCWILGTFIFACYVNWTVSVRNILPMAPAVGILLARCIARSERAGGRQLSKAVLFGSLVPALAVSLLVARADYVLADSARRAAVELTRTYSATPSKIWFEGHWGFQYYLELLGGRALDYKNPAVAKGDVIVVPSNNSYTLPVPPALAIPAGSYRFDAASLFSTMSYATGAGFYSDSRGSLPFVAGAAPSEVYQAYSVVLR